jgi:protein-disulfide isomerase
MARSEVAMADSGLNSSGSQRLHRYKAIIDTLSTVFVMVAAAAVLWRLYTTPSPPGSRPSVEEVKGLNISSSKMTNARGTGRIALIEFSDYECPFCARHSQTTGPTIEKELLDSGGIKHVFLNFPLSIHPRAQKAGEAAECAGRQGRFWEMHYSLFEDNKALEATDLSTRAERLGLDQAQFIDCLQNGDTADKVRADVAEGTRLGVNSTPTFFIGTVQPDGTIELVKRINGAVPFEQFKKVFDELLPTQRAHR